MHYNDSTALIEQKNPSDPTTPLFYMLGILKTVSQMITPQKHHWHSEIRNRLVITVGKTAIHGMVVSK